MTDTTENLFAMSKNFFVKSLAEQGDHDLVLMRADDARDMVRLKTQVKRMFILFYLDELEKVNEFARFESGRGTPLESMMCEIATLCGLMEVCDG